MYSLLYDSKETRLPETNLGGYLYSAVYYKIFDLFAHQQIKSKYIDSFKDYQNTHATESTDHLVRENQFRADIDKEIDALPPKMKRIFQMSRKLHLSLKEIAQELGTSENNVSTQITTALRILRAKLGMVIILFTFRHLK